MWLRVDIGDDVVAGDMADGSAPRSQPGTISCGTATSFWEDFELLLLAGASRSR